MRTQGLLVVVVIGLASNLDNVGIGLSYGARQIQVPWRSVLLVASMSFLAALIGGFSGSFLTTFFGPEGEFVGSTILICLGVSIIIQALIQRRRGETREADLAKQMSAWELGVIAVTQSITDLTVGFGTGVSHINVVLTALSIGVFSYLLLGIPAIVGRKFLANWFGNSAAVVSGLLLIVVGLHQY